MRKPDIYGIIGSIIFSALLLLLLFLIIIPAKEKEEDEGIIVSFGTFADGGGRVSKSTNELPQAKQEEIQPTTPVIPKSSVQEKEQQEFLTQADESLQLAEEQEKEKKRKEREELERKKREKERKVQEQERLAEEQRLAEERRLAEEKRKQQEAIEKANALADMFGSTDNAEASGSSDSSQRQGNPVGRGFSQGNSWSLEGRSLLGNLLLPAYNKDIEGIITVSIRVDESGKVVGAFIGSPTTISDAQTRKATIEAAGKTKFSAGKTVSTGTITYNFKLN